MERKLTTFQQDVIDRLGRIEEQNTTQFKRLEALEKAINGNGRPGLLTRVQALEDVHRAGDRFHTALTAWAALIVSAGGFLTGFFRRGGM